jgi:D-alanyl-D-alanine carboxypeptidase/D-alanyl-D-alanine-endopeptidase (penicillin-binding protein 4)
MKKILYLLCSLLPFISNAQTPIDKLHTAFETLEKEASYQQAAISFTLIDTKTGKILFDKNKNLALASASILKTFTTASALHYLGDEFRYHTNITFKGRIHNHVGSGQLIIYGSGDPSLGSDRFEETQPELIKKQLVSALHNMGIDTLKGSIRIVSNLFTDEGINKAWLEEDVANYYGAGIYPLNWKENKFEISMTPSGNSFDISHNTAGYNNQTDFCVELIPKDGATTEDAFAFFEKNKSCRYAIRGVLSNKENIQRMQLARLDPAIDFTNELTSLLQDELHFQQNDSVYASPEKNVTTILSPPLSKLVYWCNQKSLNLYAEAFCKTIAAHRHKKGSWTTGIADMLQFATARNIHTNGIALKDACGLAPENKITTSLLAQMLRHNVKETWYPVFYESLPLINDLHMKSGYIGGTRSYAGYIKLKDGRNACFAFILHNYSCTPKEAKLKMFELLDLLK